jgi:GT2 family glycosyltransferase
MARGEYFCVVNPDIRIQKNPFPALLEALADPASPSPHRSCTHLPGRSRTAPVASTPAILLRKLRGGRPEPDYPLTAPVVFPDWVAGMFMVFRREAFAALGGFDERYFLYYEDVDVCARARSRGMEVALVTDASVVHHARRASRRNLRHVLWHARSALRYFAQPRTPRPGPHRPPQA